MSAQSVEPGGRQGASGRNKAPRSTEEHALVLVKQEPYNAETPLFALREACTPTQHVYVRCHFPIPACSPEEWSLYITGAIEHPLALSLDKLKALPAKTMTATLECAGNDRIGLTPLPKGEPWGAGAVSTGVWRGVMLRSVLQQAGLHESVVELLFEGADQGTPEGVNDGIPFARALPLDKALDPDTLLVYDLNGAALPPEHGGPLRLLVPDWYGMASVKWLARITALEHPFDGHFQTQSYVLERPGQAAHVPLQTMRVKSLITSPATGATLPPGRHLISGVAWSGDGMIIRVEISTEGEGPWRPARLVGAAAPHTWQQWEWEWDATRPGRHVLRVRATDGQGNTQPDVAEWNWLGYANNAIQSVIVEIGD
jgi:DMSO/TMAO reductase YedYZ molybdopterin-dependent catalytic subunit